MIFYCPSEKPGVVEKHPPPPSPKEKKPPTTRLRITNGCDKEPLWIAYMAKHMFDSENIKLDPLQSHDLKIPSNLSSTRYWPKLRCNSRGSECSIGDSGGPGQKCDHTLGCAPPLDTKFEGTFGLEGKTCNLGSGETDGCDFVDVSLVDGFTVPFKFDIYGDCKARRAKHTDKVSRTVDCSKLSVAECPCHEDLGSRKDVSLKVANPDTNIAMGCYSPCSKLTYSNWRNDMALGVKPDDKTASPYCCPTPPETPESCASGPVNRSQYVQAIHRMCPGVYGYAYDDGMGLLTCPAGTRYEMTFYCPTEAPEKCAPAPVPPMPPCGAGDTVKCPGTDKECAGNECCDDGSTCPSAHADYKECLKPKRSNCVKSGLASQ